MSVTTIDVTPNVCNCLLPFKDGILFQDVLLPVFAGHITTVHLIGGGVYTLLEHPSQKQARINDWSLAGGAIDEVLRYL